MEQSTSPSWKKPRETESCVVEAKEVTVRPEKEEVPFWETRVPVEVAPERVRFPRAAFPAVRLPPFNVRYAKEAPFPVVVDEMKRFVVEAIPVVVAFVTVIEDPEIAPVEERPVAFT